MAAFAILGAFATVSRFDVYCFDRELTSRSINVLLDSHDEVRVEALASSPSLFRQGVRSSVALYGLHRGSIEYAWIPGEVRTQDAMSRSTPIPAMDLIGTSTPQSDFLGMHALPVHTLFQLTPNPDVTLGAGSKMPNGENQPSDGTCALKIC